MAEREDQLRKEAELARKAAKKGDTGLPGGGQGRKDETGITNVYPASGPAQPPGDAKLQPMGTWGQAGRGPEGYNDSGSSEIIPNERLTEDEQKGKGKASK
ncbi:MAG TPA: hypothetical protein VJ739_09410 [Gemmataceae bacterium]|nr:hypothetical protein [Gemmataceae bacterium]